MNDKLSVSAIRSGTVIDHIPEGQAFRIVRLLSLANRPNQMMMGINLVSSRIKKKDLIKIEDCTLSEDEVSKIMAFAPKATINRIENYKVVEKISGCLPAEVRAVFVCPNAACITHTDAGDTIFYPSAEGKKIILTCHYCEGSFDRDHVESLCFHIHGGYSNFG